MGLFCARTIGPSNNDKQTENRRRYSVLENNQSYFVVSHFFLQKTFSSSNQAMERLFCLIMILQITLNDMFIKNNLQNRVLIEINLVYGNLFSLCTSAYQGIKRIKGRTQKMVQKKLGDTIKFCCWPRNRSLFLASLQKRKNTCMNIVLITLNNYIIRPKRVMLFFSGY